MLPYLCVKREHARLAALFTVNREDRARARWYQLCIRAATARRNEHPHWQHAPRNP
jgi:hypothetical protein